MGPMQTYSARHLERGIGIAKQGIKSTKLPDINANNVLFFSAARKFMHHKESQHHEMWTVSDDAHDCPISDDTGAEFDVDGMQNDDFEWTIKTTMGDDDMFGDLALIYEQEANGNTTIDDSQVLDAMSCIAVANPPVNFFLGGNRIELKSGILDHIRENDRVKIAVFSYMDWLHSGQVPRLHDQPRLLYETCYFGDFQFRGSFERALRKNMYLMQPRDGPLLHLPFETDKLYFA
ncbi:hypothetical protein BC940DRAFT_338420 [Gongronella butleri]|nr:hypothetical protein BC940DRAFT_338420 [Gongronella butleri]